MGRDQAPHGIKSQGYRSTSKVTLGQICVDGRSPIARSRAVLPLTALFKRFMQRQRDRSDLNRSRAEILVTIDPKPVTKTALHRGRTDRISLTHDLDLNL